MKLYFAPGTCALSPHIVAREAGIELALERVDIRAKTTAAGEDFLKINPKGYVPALELDDGFVLTEGLVIAQYLADLKPEAKLVPANGTRERYELQSALTYVNSEIHKTYSPLFSPSIAPATREERLQYLKKRYALVDKQLEGKQFWFGDQFTVVDSYLFAITNWAPHLGLDLSEYANVQAFQKRVAERPSVIAALAAEKAAH